jgi:hypothetical protein
VRESHLAEAEREGAQEAPPVGAGVGPVPALALAGYVGNRAFAAHALARAGRPGGVTLPDGAPGAGRSTPLEGSARARDAARPGGSRLGNVARPARAALARYMQGEAGHGGIEEAALGKLFTGLDGTQSWKSVYFGNWLRDWSQIGESGERSTGLMDLLNILALGEFDRELTDADLGTYVPSEHLDNPEGGGSVEDPRIEALQYSSDPADRAKYQAALDKLSPAQKTAYEQERAAHAQIVKAHEETGLPTYIEQGKMHAKEELAQAVTQGETPTGMQSLGNALHAIEDYFAHSNFTEVCIAMLNDQGNPAAQPLMDKMIETSLGKCLAELIPQDASGNYQIQTGTYQPGEGGKQGANQQLSLLEALDTQLHSGELAKTFVVGWVRKSKLTALQVIDKLEGPLAAAAGVGIELLREFLQTNPDPTGPSVPPSPPTPEQKADDNQLAAQVGDLLAKESGAVVEAVMDVIGVTATCALLDIALPVATVYAKAEATTEHKEELAGKSADEAEAAGLKGPTHSQIAKDDDENPLFGVSRALAVQADTEIGTKIKAVWAAMPKESQDPGASGASPQDSQSSSAPPAGGAPGQAPADGSGSSTPDSSAPGSSAPGSASGSGAPAPGAATNPTQLTPQQLEVTELVDKFVCNPAQNTWWQPIVEDAARGAAGS